MALLPKNNLFRVELSFYQVIVSGDWQLGAGRMPALPLANEWRMQREQQKIQQNNQQKNQRNLVSFCSFAFNNLAAVYP